MLADIKLTNLLFFQNVKDIIIQSDNEKGTTKGQEMLQQIIHLGMATFQIKSLIKRRTVNNLIKNHSN